MATKRPFPHLAYAGKEAPGWQSRNDIRLKLKDEVSSIDTLALEYERKEKQR